MKRSYKEIEKEILFYTKKLNPIKKIEALDFIKWLWGGPGKGDEFTSEEIKKTRVLASRKGGHAFKNWDSAKKYLKELMC